MDISRVYTELADAVSGAKLMGSTLRVTATDFAPDSPTVPHFYLAEFTGVYEKTFGGLMELTITARLLLSRGDERSGQQEAQRLASAATNTIRSVLVSARGAPGQSALNGEADDLWLQRVTGPRLYDFGEDHYYGLEFTIFVMG